MGRRSVVLDSVRMLVLKLRIATYRDYCLNVNGRLQAAGIDPGVVKTTRDITRTVVLFDYNQERKDRGQIPARFQMVHLMPEKEVLEMLPHLLAAVVRECWMNNTCSLVDEVVGNSLRSISKFSEHLIDCVNALNA